MPPLPNRRQELFALECAAGAPLAQAYIAAGYKEGRGYDCRHNGSRLYNRPHVKERVRELQAQNAERSAISAEYIRERLAGLFEIDPMEAFEVKDGRVKLRPLDELPQRVRRSINRVELDESGRPTRLVFADRVAAATTLLRSLGEIKDSDVRIMNVLSKTVESWSEADLKLVEERLAKSVISSTPEPVALPR